MTSRLLQHSLRNRLPRLHLKALSVAIALTAGVPLHSVMAAAFGVQSGKNRTRDFSHGKASHFLIMGLLFTLVFALTLYGIVTLVVHLAGV